MKTNSTYTLLILLASIFLTISCGKNVDTIPPETIDSVKSILPKQVILTTTIDEGTGEIKRSLVFSMKYDTANHRIEIYEDDTTNTNPYDRLAIAYNFNNDGYLVKFETNLKDFWGGYTNNGTAIINRSADNKIIYIANYDKDYNTKDTSFYKYQSVSNGLNITALSDWTYNVTYHYDNTNKLLDYHGTDAYSATFFYNANNSINKMLVTQNSAIYNNQSDFLYNSGLPDDNEDKFQRLLLGKDYYLWDLQLIYPFNFPLNYDYDNYLISATNPYHLTFMKDTHLINGNQPAIDKANLTYEINGNKLLSKVSCKVDVYGHPEGFTMELNY